MASEIRVDKINSLSGVGTVTLSPTGVDIAGITTAATLKATTGIVTTLTATTGIVTSLEATTGDITTLRAPTGIVTSLEATTGNITTLRAPTGIVTSLEATTGNITTLRAPTGIVTTFVTNTANVGAAVTISESGIEASGIGITCANINGTQIGGRRNIIINGAMNVSQYGTSSTAQNYGAIDRFKIIYSGHDEAPTHAQVDVAAGTTPYTSGFRKAYKITNGNQTSGAQSSSRIEVQTNLEGQDVAQSGWNYVSSSSDITLSFWIKSSVAQSFASRLQTQTAGDDGNQQRFKFNFALSANTWTKVTKTIPGNTNLAITNDNQNGFRISFYAFMGTNFTDSTTATDIWAANTGGDRADDMTTTWYTTNDSTLEITGVQLEVGSQATPFEHHRFAEELLCCQRYYVEMGGGNYGDYSYMTGYMFNNGNNLAFGLYLPCAMRATPTIAITGTLKVRESGNTVDANSPAIGGYDTNSNWIACSIGMVSDMGSNGDPATLTNTNNAGITLSAEL